MAALASDEEGRAMLKSIGRDPEKILEMYDGISAELKVRIKVLEGAANNAPEAERALIMQEIEDLKTFERASLMQGISKSRASRRGQGGFKGLILDIAKGSVGPVGQAVLGWMGAE